MEIKQFGLKKLIKQYGKTEYKSLNSDNLIKYAVNYKTTQE
jgi:UDP-N-acetylglucosamine transferase subunit ALG13